MLKIVFAFIIVKDKLYLTKLEVSVILPVAFSVQEIICFAGILVGRKCSHFTFVITNRIT